MFPVQPCFCNKISKCFNYQLVFVIIISKCVFVIKISKCCRPPCLFVAKLRHFDNATFFSKDTI